MVERREQVIRFLFENGYVPEGTPVIRKNPRGQDVEGRDIYGHVPMRIGALANSVTQVMMPPVNSSYNFSLKQLNALATVRRFVVREVPVEGNE